VSLGKLVWNDRGRYEGEFKDGMMHGEGKKEVISFIIYIF